MNLDRMYIMKNSNELFMLEPRNRRRASSVVDFLENDERVFALKEVRELFDVKRLYSLLDKTAKVPCKILKDKKLKDYAKPGSELVFANRGDYVINRDANNIVTIFTEFDDELFLMKFKPKKRVEFCVYKMLREIDKMKDKADCSEEKKKEIEEDLNLNKKICKKMMNIELFNKEGKSIKLTGKLAKNYEIERLRNEGDVDFVNSFGNFMTRRREGDFESVYLKLGDDTIIYSIDKEKVDDASMLDNMFLAIEIFRIKRNTEKMIKEE